MTSRKDRERDRAQDPTSQPSPRSRSQTPDLPDGAEPISDSEYFTKNAEFRVWLKDEKNKYFDEISGEKARSYFRKFVKAWNRGKVPKSLYTGVDPAASASSNTAYKWKFASKGDADSAALRAARNAVNSDTYGPSSSSGHISRSTLPSSSSSSGGRRTIGPTLGPTMPTADDLILAREDAASRSIADAFSSRKRARAEERDRVEDVVGPKDVGREGMLEKKRAKRENDREFRNAREDAGLEMDEGTLMGGGDSFRARIAQRDASRKRFEEKRGDVKDERAAVARDRQNAMRERDSATMDMFKKMAKERFG